MFKKIWKSFTRLVRSNNKKLYSYQSHQTDYLTFRHRSKAEVNLVTLGDGRTEFQTPFTSRLNNSQGAKGHPSSRVIQATYHCESYNPWNNNNDVISVTFGCGI
uniref:Uncharacterized protein n=1 Tax=Daphnia galeata TaxID=27404 RepID=A0A8J2RCW1_9CRUS|nr:unnamed protein product [Daphnia galeata]